MNALLEFTIISAVSFFLFMFLGYKDALRTKAPSGPLAKLFNNFSFWKAQDENGIRGILYRQNLLLKLVVALLGAAVIRIIYALFFDFSIASEFFDSFTGLTGFLMNAAIIFIGIYLSYLWPSVRSKAKEISQSAYKDIKEKKLEVQNEVKKPIENQPEPQAEKPKEQNDKKSSNDIIDDYLK